MTSVASLQLHLAEMAERWPGRALLVAAVGLHQAPDGSVRTVADMQAPDMTNELAAALAINLLLRIGHSMDPAVNPKLQAQCMAALESFGATLAMPGGETGPA